MDYATFMQRYGTSQRRRDLIDLLKSEVEAVAADGGQFRAFVFGSVVTRLCEPNPGDIDVLLSLSRPADATRWFQKTSSDDLQIMKHERRPKEVGDPMLPACLTAVALLSIFNGQEVLVGSEVRVDLSDLVEFSLQARLSLADR